MNNKNTGSVNGKGYYIALALCALAIGISGYLYYANANEEKPQLGGQDVTLTPTVTPTGEDISVVATTPRELEPGDTKPTEPAPTVTKQPMKTAAPVAGEVAAAYAMEALSYNPTTRDWRVHNGMDIAAAEGTAVLSAAAGEVYTVYEDEMMGMTVVIRHENGFVTRYSSLDKAVSVAPGDKVTLGQQIGAVGNTALQETAIGPHVHFSVTQNDEPVDPQTFLAN